MKANDLNINLIDGYFGLLKNLSPDSKLELIARLSKSIKSDLKNKKDSFEKAFGAFESKESAEELVSIIRQSRTFNRQIEEF